MLKIQRHVTPRFSPLTSSPITHTFPVKSTLNNPGTKSCHAVRNDKIFFYFPVKVKASKMVKYIQLLVLFACTATNLNLLPRS